MLPLSRAKPLVNSTSVRLLLSALRCLFLLSLKRKAIPWISGIALALWLIVTLQMLGAI